MQKYICSLLIRGVYRGGGAPTLDIYSSEKTDVRMSNKQMSDMRKDRIFATHGFGSKNYQDRFRAYQE